MSTVEIVRLRGQIMPVGLILVVVSMLAWSLSHHLGQLIHHRASLLRAADAAAYSAAVVQARAMNLLSYLNRAQLAHQVTMLHLITAASAHRYRTHLAGQALKHNPPAALIGHFFGPQYARAYVSAHSASAAQPFALTQLSEAFVRHDDLVHEIINQVRIEQHRLLPKARNHTLEQVLVNNVGQSGSGFTGDSLAALGLTYALPMDELTGFVSLLSGADQTWQGRLQRAAKKYDFLAERNKSIRSFWAINARCPHKRHELRRKGVTSVTGSGKWIAQDTQSFHALRHNKMIGCYHREYPMGWATVSASVKNRLYPGSTVQASNAPAHFDHSSFWKWALSQSSSSFNIFSGNDNPLALAWSKQSEIQWNTRGFANYSALTPSRGSSIRLVLAVRQQLKPLSTRALSVTSGFPTRGHDNGVLPIQALHARAASETYFSSTQESAQYAVRPANVFQPFWKARLIKEPSNLMRSTN